MEANDADLLRRARRDPEAFCRFYERHAPPLRGWLLRQTGAREVANDLTAETFAQALVSLHRFRGRDDASAAAWLYAIARHLLSQQRRRGGVETAARRRLAMPISGYSDFDASDQLLDANASAPLVREALVDLPPGERQALNLRVVEELSYDEVAARLGIEVPAARMRVHRALTNLRLRMRGAER